MRPLALLILGIPLVLASGPNGGQTPDKAGHVNPKPILILPAEMPPPDLDGVIRLDSEKGKSATTLDPVLQARLSAFLTDVHLPIASVVLVDAHTGSIKALVQGRTPTAWGGRVHTGVYAGFPAASVFKTVVATAAFEVAGLGEVTPQSFSGSCNQVRETGDWLSDRVRPDLFEMSLRRAYGLSCNGFFAKIAVNELGMGLITDFARRFGWETGVPADFQIERSLYLPPRAETSSTSTVGRFAAGFGSVGLSPVHAASMGLSIARNGMPKPLRILRDTPDAMDNEQPIFSAATAAKLRTVMAETVQRGTAAFAFQRGRYRALRDITGGKTGTLTGSAPKGLVSWFMGMAPINDPTIIVAAVVVLEDRWLIKAPNLAAEALLAYFDEQRPKEHGVATSLFSREASFKAPQ